jgi:XTP/dITP diphosphohydrolase
LSPPARIVLATRSPGKLVELRSLFAASGIGVSDLAEAGVTESAAEDELERFDSFEDNARAKARHFQNLLGTPVVAEDSGLEVPALGGRPGVFSKRWSGRSDLSGRALDGANNELLLRELAGGTDRSARYVCVAVYLDGEREIMVRGEAPGEIADSAVGGGGFGYDPLFFSAEAGCRFSELSVEEKGRISHRGRAFRGLLERLLES